MKVKERQIEKLSRLILGRLVQNAHIELHEKEGVVLERIQKVFKENLKAEQLIDLEARNIMEQYSAQIEHGTIDSGKMFSMIKKKLVKEKNFII